MTTFTETGHAAGFIMSEAQGNRSRDNVTLVAGHAVKAGQIMGILTSGGKTAPWDNNAGDGTTVAKSISINDADSTAGDILIAVISRDAEVNTDELVVVDTSPHSTAASAAADLLAAGIILR